jgi:hypothetical protein
MQNLGKWIVDLNLSPGFANKDALIPSKFSGVNALLSGYSLESLKENGFSSSVQIRASSKFLSLQSSNDLIRTIRLPTANDLFTQLFAQAGYQVRKDEKGRYYQGMITLVGGLDSMFILKDEISSKLFEDENLLTGKAYVIDEMMKRFRLGKRIQELKEIIWNLALNSVLLRGYYLRCANCDLTRWYGVNDGKERMACQGCLSEFQMATDMKQAYRLNELFIRGIEQGARTVLLTLMVLKAIVHNSLIWEAGFELNDSNETKVDIDLAAMCDGYLVVSECKDSLSSNITELKSQLERDIQIAEMIGTDVFILSTFDSAIPEDIINFIDEYEKTSNMPVYIFTKEDLIRGRLVDSTDKKSWVFIENLIKPNLFYEGECGEKDTNNSVNSRIISG